MAGVELGDCCGCHDCVASVAGYHELRGDREGLGGRARKSLRGAGSRMDAAPRRGIWSCESVQPGAAFHFASAVDARAGGRSRIHTRSRFSGRADESFRSDDFGILATDQ